MFELTLADAHCFCYGSLETLDFLCPYVQLLPARKISVEATINYCSLQAGFLSGQRSPLARCLLAVETNCVATHELLFDSPIRTRVTRVAKVTLHLCQTSAE